MFGIRFTSQRADKAQLADKALRARAGRLMVVAATVGVAVAMTVVGPAVPASAAKKTAARCDAVTGWSNAAGRPVGLTRLGASGVYVWNEKGVWRLSVTHADRRLQRFQGSISFDAAITARPVGAEGTFGDVVQTNGSTVSFSFANFGGVDGVAVTAACAAAVTITATVDGQPIAPAQMFIGGAATNPSAVPVVITKSVPLAAAASATVGQTTTSVRECANTAWASGLQGRPAVLKNTGRNATPGMYLWAEKSVLRAVIVGEPGKPLPIDGTLTANAEVRVTPIGLEGRRDSLKAEGTVATFSFKSGGGLDGLELTSPCATQVVIEATINDGPITLFLGPNAAAVPAMPYLLTR